MLKGQTMAAIFSLGSFSTCRRFYLSSHHHHHGRHQVEKGRSAEAVEVGSPDHSSPSLFPSPQVSAGSSFHLLYLCEFYFDLNGIFLV
jgi:hypothetical protein